jgi:hypothetical protein
MGGLGIRAGLEGPSLAGKLTELDIPMIIHPRFASTKQQIVGSAETAECW